MNTKNNQRYHDMDICMKAALLELMQEMEFEKITVKRICERAGVNRGTFYYHYTDIYAMLQEAEDYLSGELLRITEEWSAETEYQNESLLIPYLRYIREHRYFYRVALANRNVLPIQKTFKPLWEKLVLPKCQMAGITEPDDRLYYSIAFEGCVSMTLRRWIETDCQKEEQQIAEILQNCLPSF